MYTMLSLALILHVFLRQTSVSCEAYNRCDTSVKAAAKSSPSVDGSHRQLVFSLRTVIHVVGGEGQSETEEI